VVITSKYTVWTFLPKFTFESFKKLANAYFLLVSIMQCIPAISNTGNLPSSLPVLLFILAVLRDALISRFVIHAVWLQNRLTERWPLSRIDDDIWPTMKPIMPNARW
jgi:hypothetical protein